MGESAAELEQVVRALIVPGFNTLDVVLESAQEWAENTGFPTATAQARARAVWQARLAEESAWSGLSDYERLVHAYADLERDGILARMNFACCTNCANDEIDFERSEHPDPPDWYRYREWGYVYFHSQDAERLADPAPELMFGYSTFRALPDTPADLLAAADAGDAAAEAEITRRRDTVAGELVAAAFRRCGLRVNWSGDPQVRIGVEITSWHKPLPRGA